MQKNYPPPPTQHKSSYAGGIRNKSNKGDFALVYQLLIGKEEAGSLQKYCSLLESILEMDVLCDY
jgi:hypothetical protein